MNILDSFVMLFEGDTSKLDKSLGEADKKADKFVGKLRDIDKEATNAGASFASLVGKLASVAGVALSFGALYLGIKHTAEQYYQLEKLALQFRATVEEIDNFRDSSKLLGITEEESTASLKGLEVAVQDTFLGMGRAKKVFDELGIHVTGADGKIKSTVLVMDELAEKFKKMDRGTQIRVMDRLGLDPKLLLLFNSDLGALQKRMTEVDQAAGFNLQLAVKRASEYTKASRGLSLELNVLKLFLSKLSETSRIAALPWLVKGIELATVYVKRFTDFLMSHSRLIQGAFLAIGAAIAAYLVPAAISGAIAIWAMIAPFLLIGAAVAGVIAVFALLYDDIQAFREGNESLIGNILKRWPMVGEVIEDVAAVLQFVGETLTDIARITVATTGIIGDAIGGLLSFAFKPLIEALGLSGGAFSTLGELAGGVLTFILDLITLVLDKFGGVVGIAKAVAGIVRGTLGAAKAAVGLAVPDGVAEGVKAGQTQLAAAASSPLASSTSNSISNSNKRGGDRNVTVEKIEIQTQATDADGIARGIGGALGSQLRQTSGQFDDGIAA
jgi:hypothetical protein